MGMHIEPAEKAGTMSAGPVVTLCVRLPEWCVLAGKTETEFRQRLQAAVADAVSIVTESDASKARRDEQNKMGSKA
jgi:hypothetical protein